MTADPPPPSGRAHSNNRHRNDAEWQQTAFGALRIAFGIVWAIDASFKWHPAFVAGFTDYLAGAMKGQPHAVAAWIGFWLHVVQYAPLAFARLIGVSESLLALSLITGTFVNSACVAGAIFSFMIWSCPEGFGGPYQPGSTDIGTSIIYIFVFAALFLASAGRRLSFDRILGPRLGRFAFLASGRTTQTPA
jgi:thiosulfate dehydrogenase [quinone] large subunit